jgi:hypothetical protein
VGVVKTLYHQSVLPPSKTRALVRIPSRTAHHHDLLKNPTLLVVIATRTTTRTAFSVPSYLYDYSLQMTVWLDHLRQRQEMMSYFDFPPKKFVQTVEKQTAQIAKQIRFGNKKSTLYIPSICFKSKHCLYFFSPSRIAFFVSSTSTHTYIVL